MNGMKRKIRERPSSTEQADLWEHANLLYHSFEWQSAANVFNHLSRSAIQDGARAKCLLNEGLIFARLGDLSIAKKLFERAASLDPAEVLPCFLLGLIEAELDHLPEALTQFEFCWETLQRGLTDHYSQGLRFELTADICRRNAEKTWARLKAQHEGKSPPSLLLESVSADTVFEAPTRTLPNASPRSSASRKTLETLQASARSTTSKVLSYLRSLEQVNPAHRPRSADELGGGEPPNTEPEMPILAPLPKPKLVLLPRDPQVKDESLRELASFLRHAGPGGSKEITIDQDYMMRLLGNDATAVLDVSLSGKSLEAPTMLEHHAARAIVKSEIDSVLEYYADSPTRRHADPMSATVTMVGSEDVNANDPNKLIENTIAELQRQAFGGAAAYGDGLGSDRPSSHTPRMSDMREIEHIPLPLSPRLERPSANAAAELMPDPARPTAQRKPVGNKVGRLLGNDVGLNKPTPRLPTRSSSLSPRAEDDGRLSPHLLGTDRTPSTVSSMDIFKFGLKDRPKQSVSRPKPGWL